MTQKLSFLIVPLIVGFLVHPVWANSICSQLFTIDTLVAPTTKIVGSSLNPDFGNLPTEALQRLSEKLKSSSNIQDHRLFAEEASRFLKTRGVQSEVACDSKTCLVIIKPGNKIWLERLARDAKNSIGGPFALTFDTQDHRYQMAKVLEYNKGDGSHPIELPYISISWSNLDRTSPSPIAWHEIVHFLERTAKDQPYLIRILEQQSGSLHQVLNPGYFGRDGHITGEFRASARQAREGFADGMGSLENANQLSTKGASPLAVEKMINQALEELQRAFLANDSVFSFTHHDSVLLGEFIRGMPYVEVRELPKESRNLFDHAFTFNPPESNGLNLSRGATILVSDRALNKSKGVAGIISPAALKSEFEGALKIVVAEMRAARAQADQLEKQIQEAKAKALSAFAKVVENFTIAQLVQEISETVSDMREDQAKGEEATHYKILKITQEKLEILGIAYLQKMNIPYSQGSVGYGAIFPKDVVITPSNSPSAHWLSKMAWRLNQRHNASLRLNASRAFGRPDFFSHYMILPWINVISDTVTNSFLAAEVKIKASKLNEKITRTGEGYGNTGFDKRPLQYSSYGRYLPELKFQITRKQFETESHTSTDLYAEWFEANRNLAMAKIALQKQNAAPEMSDRAEISILVRNSAEQSQQILEKLRVDLETLEAAIAKLRHRPEKKGLALVPPPPIEKSDMEVAAEHVLNSMEGIFHEFLGIEPKEVPLIRKTGGHGGRIITLDSKGWEILFLSGQIEAFHEEIPKVWKGDSYHYVANEKEADWSRNPEAVAEFLEYTLQRMNDFKEKVQKVQRESLVILRATTATLLQVKK